MHYHPTTDHLFPEYGSRVHLDDRYQYPKPHGTIVGSVEIWDEYGDEYEIVWTIRRDFDGTECNYVAEQFVTIDTPSGVVERMVARWGVARCLDTMENILRLGAQDRNLERYQSALIFEFYRVAYQAQVREQALADMLDDDADDDCPECDADGFHGGQFDETRYVQDDGTGYPVYRDDV